MTQLEREIPHGNRWKAKGPGEALRFIEPWMIHIITREVNPEYFL